MTTQTAYYSTKTGKRVSATYGQRNPDKVKSFNFVEGQVDLKFLNRGCTVPSSLTMAIAADLPRKLAQDVKDAKNAARRAASAAKRGKEAAAKPGATAATVRKAIGKKTSSKKQIIHKSAKSGEIVSAQFAKDNPDTTFATKGAKAAPKKAKK